MMTDLTAAKAPKNVTIQSAVQQRGGIFAFIDVDGLVFAATLKIGIDGEADVQLVEFDAHHRWHGRHRAAAEGLAKATMFSILDELVRLKKN